MHFDQLQVFASQLSPSNNVSKLQVKRWNSDCQQNINQKMPGLRIDLQSNGSLYIKLWFFLWLVWQLGIGLLLLVLAAFQLEIFFPGPARICPIQSDYLNTFSFWFSSRVAFFPGSHTWSNLWQGQLIWSCWRPQQQQNRRKNNKKHTM